MNTMPDDKQLAISAAYYNGQMPWKDSAVDHNRFGKGLRMYQVNETIFYGSEGSAECRHLGRRLMIKL